MAELTQIELGWLLVEAAEVLGDAELILRVKRIAVKIAGSVLTEGTDDDGGVFYEAGPAGVIRDSKEWWVQSEASVGFLNAYQVSGEQRFLDAALKSWAFIEAHLVDRNLGGWYPSVSRDGATKSPEPRVAFWTCPYHNSRGCMEMATRLKGLETLGNC